MSAICAVVRFDGAPVERQRLEKMAGASVYRGPDGIGYWVQGSVGLAHLAMHTTPESQRERQPLVHPAGHLVLVADARVDNRRELIDRLTERSCPAGLPPTDADLILAAYERWGTDCPRHIIGDFAFAIWDRQRHRLFCARDPLGIRSLHYYRQGSDLLVATTPESLIGWLGRIPPVNDAYLQDLVAMRLTRGTSECAYRDMHRLPPAYVLEAGDGHCAPSRYWTLGAQSEPSFRREADYIEAFRVLFEEAVRVRLRSAHPVGLLVSGGVDSSSIACMADRLLSDSAVAVPVRLYSGIFSRTPGADERAYIQAVVDHCRRIESTLIPCDDCWGLKEFGTDGGFRLLNGPELGVMRAFELRPLRAMRADGVRAFLSGIGADQALGGEAYHQPHYLRVLPLSRVLSELPFFVRYSRRPAWRLLVRAFVRPLVPDRVLAPLRRLRPAAGSSILCPPSQPEAADPLPPIPSRNPLAAWSYRQLTGTYPALVQAFDDETAQVGLESRLPFLDRRLIDFVLAAPPGLFFAGGYIKSMLRKALSGILVEKVRVRTEAAHFSALLDLGLRERGRARAEELIQSARVVRRGYLTQDELEQGWSRFLASAGPFQSRSLTGFLCVEEWLRYLERCEEGCHDPQG